MQQITLELVVNKAREYYAKGWLIAQMRNPKLRYELRKRRCAISACFTDETMAALKRRKLRDGAFTESIVELAIPTQLSEIEAIQSAHDAWAVGRGTELAFKALIGL